MKLTFPYCLLTLVLIFGLNRGVAQDNREINLTSRLSTELVTEDFEDENPLDSIYILPPDVLFDSLPTPKVDFNILNRSFNPRVFSGYRKVHTIPDFAKLKPYNGLKVMTEEFPDSLAIEDLVELNDTVEQMATQYEQFVVGKRPKWLNDAMLSHRIQEDLMYTYMIENPESIEYSDWTLPEPPVLYEDDVTFMTFLKKQTLPTVNPEDAILPEVELKKKHWLHVFNTALQLSQAFVSPNWYQGGNDYLALLFNFNWNVQLNQVYHPNILLQSNLSYKLALNSTPEGSFHKYSISEDLFQYNLNAGLKAIKTWYYSFNLLFKTQLLTNFESNSYKRTASFLSPGDLNMGLGMSYTHKNKLNTFQYTLTLSPLSYNLKTCITDKIDHSLYNIAPDKKYKNEIGSNAEINLSWKITANISYSTRLFLFTNYDYFLGDWQNTFNFEINKFLSTQLFLHLRIDTSSDEISRWKHFMMREILSFGLSYTFSTKPK